MSKQSKEILTYSIIGVAIIGIVILITAIIFQGGTIADTPNKVSASIPEGYEQVTQDDFGYTGEITVIRHIETGCYYTTLRGKYTGAITQMHIEKDGVSIPYCEK